MQLRLIHVVLLAALVHAFTLYYLRQVDKAAVLSLREVSALERVLIKKFPDLLKEAKQ